MNPPATSNKDPDSSQSSETKKATKGTIYSALKLLATSAGKS